MLPFHVFRLLLIASKVCYQFDTNVGLFSTIPLNLVFDILIFSLYIWYLIQPFRYILMHGFNVGLLVRFCYPKRSSSPYSNFCPDLFKWCLLICNLVRIFMSQTVTLIHSVDGWHTIARHLQ